MPETEHSVIHRLSIEARPGNEVNFGPDCEIASDNVGLVYYGGKLIAWTDDYGTARHPDHELDLGLRDRVEAFFEAAADLWAVLSDVPRGQKITHGRHCTCRSCAHEDWTNPDLASCGMHGSDCPALYQPWGRAGTRYDPANEVVEEDTRS